MMKSIREHIRESHKNDPQIDGIWYEGKTQVINGKEINYWKLEDEDGNAMLFNTQFHTIYSAIKEYKEARKNDVDLNYGKNKSNI